MIKYSQKELLDKINSSFLINKTYLLDAKSQKEIPVFTGEFWTAKQRQGLAIHEVSYRACFKAELPEFFIQIFSNQGEIVFDPFCGRGTTPLQASLMGRIPYANDLNPLSQILLEPRLRTYLFDKNEFESFLKKIPKETTYLPEIELSMFYHPQTLKEILALRQYFREKDTNTFLDQWLKMVVVSRLSGHSKGFFSVYTLPPNQTVSPARQIKINQKLNQTPDYRDTHQLIIKKSNSLLRGLTEDHRQKQNSVGKRIICSTGFADNLSLTENTVDLTITSPPFLDVVQYAADNWLRCWFLEIDPKNIENEINQTKTLEIWKVYQKKVLSELWRITKEHGWVAFEVGEVRQGKLDLMPHVVELALEVGFSVPLVLINQQDFTKTANIWGIKNNTHGTNSNRIVLMNKK